MNSFIVKGFGWDTRAPFLKALEQKNKVVKIEWRLFAWLQVDLLVCLLLLADVPVDDASRSNAAAPGTLDEALNNGR